MAPTFLCVSLPTTRARGASTGPKSGDRKKKAELKEKARARASRKDAFPQSRPITHGGRIPAIVGQKELGKLLLGMLGLQALGLRIFGLELIFGLQQSIRSRGFSKKRSRGFRRFRAER